MKAWFSRFNLEYNQDHVNFAPFPIILTINMPLLKRVLLTERPCEGVSLHLVVAGSICLSCRNLLAGAIRDLPS